MSSASGNFSSASDARFHSTMSRALDTRAGGPSEARVMRALNGVDPRSLSRDERSALQSLTRQLAGDGDIDPKDANELTDLIESYSSNGIDAFNGQMPASLANLGRYPGSVLFGGLLGTMIDKVVQTAQDQAFSSTASKMMDSSRGGFVENAVRQAFSNVDVSKLSISERSALLTMLGTVTQNGKISNAEGRALLQQLGKFEGKGNDYAKALEPKVPTFTAKNNGDGTAHIDISDKYSLDLNEANSQITLINKQTGEKTNIWGDPHFDAADGKQNMDFKGTVTLNLDDGTKITINTTPYGANKDAYLSSQLVVSQGNHAVVVDGLDQNTLGDLSVHQYDYAGAGKLADSLSPDGLNLYENPDGAGWMVQDGFFMRPVTQADMNTAQPGAIAQDYSPVATAVTGALLGYSFGFGFMAGMAFGSTVARDVVADFVAQVRPRQTIML